jgi:hypothetical protein
MNFTQGKFEYRRWRSDKIHEGQLSELIIEEILPVVGFWGEQQRTTNLVVEGRRKKLASLSFDQVLENRVLHINSEINASHLPWLMLIISSLEVIKPASLGKFQQYACGPLSA